MIAVERRERAASAADADAALATLDRSPGAWLGCDVAAPGQFRREAMVALDPLLSFYLDGNVLRIVPHGDIGRALAEHVATLAVFERVQGRLEVAFAAADAAPHPVISLLRRFLQSFAQKPHELGLYGALAFDYYRLSRADALLGDGRRRLALFLPRRVLLTGDSGHRWVEFDFPGLQAVPGPQAAIDTVQPERFDDDLPEGGHAQAVARGLEQMRRGALRSLVLSQTFRRRVQADAPSAFARLRRDNPYPAMFFVNLGGGERIFGASPDVQVRADEQWVETAPVCGTFRRGGDPVADHEQAKALINSAVDEASLALCSDSDRNDKALVCEPGSVELLSRRRLHFFSTIIHTIDHTRGKRRSDVDGFDIVLAHATPATVTGMPKIDARVAIASLEAVWRGWYAGAAVRIGADGSCEALTILRFARLLGDWAEVRTGGSLLADSEPVREEEETRLKAESMFRVLSGQSPRAPDAPLPEPPRRRVCFLDGGDALAALAREALVQAGCEFDAQAPTLVRGDGLLDALRSQRASSDGRVTLALNNAALALLEQDGAVLEKLEVPQFGRALDCQAVAGGMLDAMGHFRVGIYATHCVRVASLPIGWVLAAEGSDGRVIAAVQPVHRTVALLFRPDAVLSLQRSAGRLSLLAALAWLAPVPA
jgi:anthranilate synthase